MKESVIESKCRDIAKQRGWIMPKWTSPGSNGVHDRLLIGLGRIIPLEFKTPDGRLTAIQAAFHRRLGHVKVEHYVIRSVPEFIELLDRIEGEE